MTPRIFFIIIKTSKCKKKLFGKYINQILNNHLNLRYLFSIFFEDSKPMISIENVELISMDMDELAVVFIKLNLKSKKDSIAKPLKFRQASP
jgi:hypothetical protein